MDYLVQTDKFHKVILRKYSLRKIIPQDQTIRNLLCYYLSLACQKYPKNDIFEYVQNKAYDLRYDVAVSTIGSYSVLKYTLQGVDPKYINDEEYNYSFLEEFFYDCQKPVSINNNFDLKLFKKAKEIYRSNLLYLSENESKKSFNLAIKTYFKGTIRDFDNDGDLSTLKKISCKMLYKYYLSIINDEEVSYAVGDVLNHLSIENRATLTAKYDYFFKDRNKVSPLIIDNAQTKQCYLQIIYDVNIYPNHQYESYKQVYATSFAPQIKKLGYKEAEIIEKTDLTEEQKRKYRLLDNKTNELAEWDFDLLADELDGLDFGALELDWGLNAEEIEPKERQDAPFHETISVVIDCQTDNEAEEIFHRLSEEGYNCRISTL